MRQLVVLLVLAVLLLPCASAKAANTVVVESKTVMPGAANVSIGIYLVNDMSLAAIVVPLELRAVTPGAFITSMKMSFGGRLDSTVMTGRVTNQFGTKSLACSGGVPGYADLLYTTANDEHPVTGPSECALFGCFKMQTGALAPGSDVTPSMLLTLDIGLTTGTVEIDTTCTASRNHIYFVKDTPYPDPFVAVVPAFTKGVITIAACDCAHHGDLDGNGVIDVFDSSLLMDWVFSGAPAPAKDPNCPHVGRGDVDCSGADDVFDVVYLIDYVFSGGPAPCNPCACSPYPTNCP